MNVIDPGHVYELNWLDVEPGYTADDQEVLRALIDRVHYLDGQIAHPRNQYVIASLRRAIYDLECRAAERHGRLAAFLQLVMHHGPDIERMATCPKCLHIGCEGGCHA